MRKKKVRFNRLKLVLGISILIVLAVMIFSISMSRKVQISDYSFYKSKNRQFISFNLTNNYDNAADCAVKITLGNKSFSSNLGIIPARTSRKFGFRVAMPSGSSEFAAVPTCTWQSIDTTGCEKTDFRICGLLRRNAIIKQCLNGTVGYQYFCLALLSQNISYCNYILELPGLVRCKAFIGEQPKLCQQLPTQSYRDWCYQDYGINKRDSSVCENIVDASKRTSCLGAAAGNPQLCLNLTESDKALCIINLAEFLDDPNLCESLANPQYCYDALPKS